MIVPFLHPVAASLLLISSGPAFPSFPIEKICQSTVTVDRSHLTLHGCRHDERARARQTKATLGSDPGQIPQELRR